MNSAGESSELRTVELARPADLVEQLVGDHHRGHHQKSEKRPCFIFVIIDLVEQLVGDHHCEHHHCGH